MPTAVDTSVTIEDALETVADLLEFIVTELDSDPCPPEGYVTGPENIAVVRAAVARRDVWSAENGRDSFAVLVNPDVEDED